MNRKSFHHKSLILLASSALALLVCTEALTPTPAFASQTRVTLSKEETGVKIKLMQGKDEQFIGRKLSASEAEQIILNRRAQSIGGAGSVSNEEKLALEKKIEEEKAAKEEAQRLQLEQEKQLAAQREEAQKLQLEKEKAQKERLQFEAEQKILAEQIAQQRSEHEKALRELEEKHFKLTAAAKKKTAELEQELKLAAEASEFRGFDYLNKRLSVVDTRIKTLGRMVTPDQPDMQEFIDQSKDALAKLTAEASSVDIGTDKEILLDLQKNISIFSFNFEIEALDFLSRNAAKAGIALPDSFYDMSPEQQEAAINEAKKIIENKIKEAQDAEEKRAANEKLLRAKLKERAAEELEIMKKEIGDTPYLVKATKGTGNLVADLKKMEQYARADDYDKIDYQTLQDREREIGTILEQGKGNNGSIIDSFRKKINDLHAAQHPDNVTQEQIAFAEALYFKLPGKAMAMGGIGGGMLPPPPLPVQQKGSSPASSSSNAGFTPPPPPPQPSSPPPPGTPSGNSGAQVKKIPEGGNYKTLYETRLKPYLIPLPGMPGLLDASPEEIKKYIDLIIKNAKTKLQLLEDFVGTIKVTGEKEHETVSLEGGKPEIIADIKKIMDGTIESEKLYGYYLMLSALKSSTKLEDIQLKWQKDDRSNLRSLRSFINYVKTNIVEDEIQKASNAGSTPSAPKVGANSVPKNDIFAHLASLGESWAKDPDLLKIANAKEAESLSDPTKPIQPVLTYIGNFLSKAYGYDNLDAVIKALSSIPITEHDDPASILKKLKTTIADLIENISLEGHKLKTLKGQHVPDLLTLLGSKNVANDDYKHLMILLSHFLDDPSFIAELSNVEEELKTLTIKSSADLAQRLRGILDRDINTITHGNFYMDTINEETKTENTNASSASGKKVYITTYSVVYRFDIPNNVFTSQEVNSKFDALYRDLGEYQAAYGKLYENYTSGQSILAPSIGLLSITQPKVKLILEKLQRTLITVDQKTISQILDAMNDISKVLAQNKAFTSTIKKLQSEYPKLARSRKLTDVANLVEQAVDTVQLIDMKTVIPPEKQGRNVPYTYLKTFLMLKALSSTSWQIEEAKPQIPVSSSGGGHASSSQQPSSSGGQPSSSGGHPSSSGGHPSSSGGQPSTDISQIKAMPFDELIAKHGELQKEIDDPKTPSASHGDLVNEAAKYRIEIEKRQRPSEFQFWKIDEHNKEVIPLAKNMEVIVLLRKPGEHLQPDEEHQIVEFMKEIKPIQKLKSVYTSNLAKIQKYQPHLVAQIQQ